MRVHSRSRSLARTCRRSRVTRAPRAARARCACAPQDPPRSEDEAGSAPRRGGSPCARGCSGRTCRSCRCRGRARPAGSRPRASRAPRTSRGKEHLAQVLLRELAELERSVVAPGEALEQRPSAVSSVLGFGARGRRGAISMPRFDPQCGSNLWQAVRVRHVELTHPPQVRFAEAATEFGSQTLRDETKKESPVVGSPAAALVLLHDLPADLPVGGHHRRVHPAPCAVTGLGKNAADAGQAGCG